MAIYVTLKQNPRYHQMTLDEYLFQDNPKSYLINGNETNTRTYRVEYISQRISKQFENFGYNPVTAFERLDKFMCRNAEFVREDMHPLYYSFHIPKRSGGLRQIDAPRDEFMNALRELKTLLEKCFFADHLYHTAAFAYIKRRSTLDAVKKHQSNESKWFAKYDLHNFFGSTTVDFVMNQFQMVYPFSDFFNIRGFSAYKNEVMSGKELFREAISLAFLDGVLPQGTPISPLITNIMMIPVDYELNTKLRDFKTGETMKQRMIYTRYADDFIISSRYDFKFRNVQELIIETLEQFGAPFSLNTSKTRYGSSAGRNWNLGVMLNKDNEITVGHQRRRNVMRMIGAYVQNKKHGIRWDIHDVMVMEGLRCYCRQVEPENMDKLIADFNRKNGVDVVRMIKSDLSEC